MRTKTLLLTAALAAATVGTSMAQVYSVNAVGYVNLPLPSGFSIIANQFIQANYAISTLIPNPPPGTAIYQFSNVSGYSIQTFDDIDLAWEPNPNAQIPLGSGFFILLPQAYTVTFVGEVPHGTLST